MERVIVKETNVDYYLWYQNRITLGNTKEKL